MTVEDLLRRGGACEAAGDLAGAEAAYREADELGDSEGAILLGLMLKRRGEMREAVDAFQRAGARGHPEAGSCLGNLLCDAGDIDGARAAYERSIAAGSSDALLNLGLMLAQQGAVDDALRYLCAADEAGDATASWAVGRLLEDRADHQGAVAAYRRGSGRGDAQAAFGLGAVLMKLEDREGARAAFQRARDLGHERAGEVLAAFAGEDERAAGQASLETEVRWARQYADACGEVMAAANACLEAANRAIGARNMAGQRPQHEISIQTFTQFADEAEREFAPLYQRFTGACAAARDTAAQLIATQPEPLGALGAEIVLASCVDESVLDTVATVKALLHASFGPAPSAFVRGVQEANELMQQPGNGNIYTPPGPGPLS